MNNLSIVSTFGSASPVIYLLMVLDLILKGISLFKSARKGQTIWFVALLLINTLGILPIIYLLVNKEVRFTRQAAAPKRVAKKATKRSRK